MSQVWDKLLELRITRLRDEQAYSRFFEQQKSTIYAYLLVRTRDTGLAEDLTAEAFVELWKIISDREKRTEITSLRGLLFTIAKHRLIDHFRRNPKGRVLTDEYLENVEAGTNFLDALEIQVEMTEVRRVLIEMPQIYKEVITLRYLQELEFDEVAASLGKSTGAVRVLLHRAIRELRKRLL